MVGWDRKGESERHTSKHRCVLMHRHCPECIPRCNDRPQRLIPPNIPELDLPIATSTNQLSKPSTLHMHVCDPLFMLAPDLDHRLLGTKTLIENADRTIAVAGHEDVTGYLV